MTDKPDTNDIVIQRIFIGFILNTMTAEEAVCHRIMGICTFKTLPCRRDIILCPVILHFPTPFGHFLISFTISAAASMSALVKA